MRTFTYMPIIDSLNRVIKKKKQIRNRVNKINNADRGQDCEVN